MTEKEMKAYNERGEKRTKKGKLLKLFRSRDVTMHKVEKALIVDAKGWQDDFFKMFMGTPDLQAYYNKSKVNKRFLDDLFRHAFMYGGCYSLNTWNEFGKDPSVLTPEEMEELKRTIDEVNEEMRKKGN